MAEDLIGEAYDTFWSEWFWLPGNVSWADLQSTTDKPFPEANWLYKGPLAAALIFILVRWVVDHTLTTALGRAINISDSKRPKATRNAVLEHAYGSCRRPDEKAIGALTRKCDGWSRREVERWFFVKRAEMKPSLLVKFRESVWRVIFYFGVVVFAYYNVLDKAWFWDPDQIVIGWPVEHYLTSDIRWYYTLQIGFYVSQLATIMWDVKRKDFIAMSLHHVSDAVYF